MRLDARTSLYCHEYLHKKNAPNRFDLTNIASDDEVAKERKRLGLIHEANVFALLKSSSLKVEEIDVSKAVEDRAVETARALLNPYIDVILGATIDEHCEYELQKTLGDKCSGDPVRTSRPDILFRTGEFNGFPVWSPVDVKSHSAIVENKSNSVSILDLTSVTSEQLQRMAYHTKIEGRLAEEDSMQLFHYIVHLAALGLGNPEHSAGIIGIDGASIVWADMNAMTFGRGKSSEAALARYHRTFAEAQQVVNAAILRASDDNQPKPAIPQLLGGKFGCPECEFRNICMDELLSFDNKEGHVTLLATVTPDKRAANFPNIHSMRELRGATGLNDFGRIAQLRANVWKSGKPVLIDPATPLNLPEFDIEIDIDLENSMEALIERDATEASGSDRVYLYGYGIHDRTKNIDWHSVSPQSIFDYSDTDGGELDVLLTMWKFLVEEVKKAELAGKSIGIFHYSSHERTWWRNFARKHSGNERVPTLDDVEIFMQKYFVDLYTFTQKISFPTISYSIKQLAPHAGFEWEFEDAGGAMSLIKYKAAIDKSRPEAEQKDAQEWLRRYNLDDIRATFAVRNYVRALGF